MKVSRINTAAHDSAGHPIVAELGRAETVSERQERTSASRAMRRANQTATHLLLSLLASLGVVVFLVLVVVRADREPLYEPVDYFARAREAQGAIDVPLILPDLDDGWQANRAELVRDSGGVLSWQIGFVTPSQNYLALSQGFAANPSWLGAQLSGAQPDSSVIIDGISWIRYDRRDVPDPGNLAYALSVDTSDSTVLLAGTAPDDEFAQLARAIAGYLSE